MRTDALSYWRLLERPRRALFRALLRPRLRALLRALLRLLLRALFRALLRALLRALMRWLFRALFRALRFRLVGARAPNAERFDGALLLFVRRAGVPHFAHRARPKSCSSSSSGSESSPSSSSFSPVTGENPSSRPCCGDPLLLSSSSLDS
jgi:hypothetical protein